MKKTPNIKKTPKESLRDPTGQIKCLMFHGRNEVIEGITEAINETKDVNKKALLAERLLREVEALLSCAYFDEKRVECKVCHSIAKLRRQAANLIIKARQLKK